MVWYLLPEKPPAVHNYPLHFPSNGQPAQFFLE